MSSATKKKGHAAQHKNGKKLLPGKSGHRNSVSSRFLHPWAVLAIGIVFLCVLMTNNWYFKMDTQLSFAIITCAIFAGSLLFRENRQILAGRISKISMVLIAQCLLYCAALFYARFPKLELQQFFLNIGSLLVFLSAYISFSRNELNIGFFLKLFAAYIAVASLVSIELATSGYLRPVFVSVAALFNTTIPNGFGAFETNTRITTILGNANVFAPITVFGIFVSVWNYGEPGEQTRKAFIHLGLAIISGTAFILCFSLGTILAYIVALAVCIIAVGKGRRGSQFLVHIFILIVSLVGAGIVFALRNMSLAPTLAVLVLAGGTSFLYSHVKPVRLPTLSKRVKIAGLIGIAAICAAIISSAFLLRGSYSLEKDGFFKRATALNAGAYSFTAVLNNNSAPDATMTVEISSMNYVQAALKEKTVLKTVQLKSGEAADFTVPESSAAVFVSLTADEALTVNSALIDGGGKLVQLPLHYTIVPEFIINRLQGIWVNDNAIQRFVFFRDGIRLGLKSPIVGLGGGAFEGGLYSVSDYYYVTNHSHNEYIERFAEGGAIGALLFIALPVFVFLALWKARQSEKARKMIPLLAGCMTLIFAHALLESDFLFSSYRIAAYALIALVAAVCGDCLELGRKLRAAFATAISLLFAGNAVLALGHYSALKLMSYNPTLKSFQTAMIIDPVNKDDYMLSYLMNTRTTADEKTLAQQESYLKSMKGDVYGIFTRAKFCFTKAVPDYCNGISLTEAYIKENRVNPDAWDMMFSLYGSSMASEAVSIAAKQQIADSALRMYAYLEELNKSLPKKIEPKMADHVYQQSEMFQSGNPDTTFN